MAKLREEDAELLDQKLALISEALERSDQPAITVTFFEEDLLKGAGCIGTRVAP